MNKDKILSDIGQVYSEIYTLEKKRKEINKTIALKTKRLYAILNHVRIEGDWNGK